MTSKDTLALKKFLGKLYIAFGLAASAAVLAVVFTWSHGAIHDLDIWLHLKSGELILQNKAPVFLDPFSFTFAQRPWVNHEWLFQVICALIYPRWQADGLILLEVIVLTAAFIVLFMLARRAGLPHPLTALLLLAAATASSGRFNIRPEIFSLLFFALYLYILRFNLNKKTLWLLVPLQVLWVNLHGYFFLGALLVAIFFAGEFLQRSLSDADWRRLRKVFFLTLLACLLNPNGIKGALYPFYILKGVFSGQHGVFFRYIQELQPTFKSAQSLNSNPYFYLIMALAPLLMLLNLRRLKAADICLLVFFFLFSFKIRNIAFFVFVGYMIIALYWNSGIKRCASGITLAPAFKEALYWVSGFTLSLFIIGWGLARVEGALSQIYYDFSDGKFKSQLTGIDTRRYPAQAADFLLSNDIPGNMFNDFNSGAYLIGRAYPRRRVFIDGRTEFYGQKFFRNYLKFLNADEPTVEATLKSYHLDGAFLNTALNFPAKVVAYLYKSPQWKLVFLDEAAVVFLKDVPANQPLIKKYYVNLRKYNPPAPDIKAMGFRRIYPFPYIKRAKLFDLLQEDALVEQEAKAALEIMPGCAEAYHFLGRVALRRKNYPQARDNLRWAVLLFPNNSEMLADLAAALRESGEYERAINAARRALEASPRYARAYQELGLAYLAQKNTAEALRQLRKALDSSTQDEDKELVREIEAQISRLKIK